MRTVSYGGESFTTSDEAAAALLDFAAAAALNDFAAVVHVPALDETGDVMTADLVIGPASELFVTPSKSGFEDLDTTDAVADLRQRTNALGASRHVSVGGSVSHVEDDGNYLEFP